MKNYKIILFIVVFVILISGTVIYTKSNTKNRAIINNLKTNETSLKNQVKELNKNLKRVKDMKKVTNIQKTTEEKEKLQYELQKELQYELEKTKQELATLGSQIKAIKKLKDEEKDVIIKPLDKDIDVYGPIPTNTNMGMFTNIRNNSFHPPGMWYRVGLVMNSPIPDNHGVVPDATVLTLYRQDIMPDRDIYTYKVVDNKTLGLEVYLPTSVSFLNNNDKIPSIVGYENKGVFTVKLDQEYMYVYMRT